MNAGYRKHKIIIQINDVTIINGNEVDNWTDYYTCYAYANGLSGSEFWMAGALQAENTVVFEVRFCSEIKAMDTKKYRIIFNNQFYNILNIDNIMFLNDNVKIRGQVGTWEN